jgi:hypothetical protein
MGILDVAFPHRVNKTFGAASFALVFLIAVVEIETLVLIALGIVAHRFDLFVTLQVAVLPAACVVALATAIVFWWRARAWSRARLQGLAGWAGGGSAYGERLAKSRHRPR